MEVLRTAGKSGHGSSRSPRSILEWSYVSEGFHMDEDSFEYHKNKKTGKTYVSRSIVSTDRPGEPVDVADS
jgi:hypothetical protein